MQDPVPNELGKAKQHHEMRAGRENITPMLFISQSLCTP
uniref:Uncharacterized protein n=1 Tax=Arundo donax TaxID=35708 RepID=A0A0A9SBR7_ARUDO